MISQLGQHQEVIYELQTTLFFLPKKNTGILSFASSLMARIFQFLLFLSISFKATAQPRQANITLNSSLTPRSNTPSWISPSSLFSFRFYPQGNGFAVGVWLDGTSNKTIVVWTAN
eukprot:TRINITY_DN54916_c0_g1_i1.p1 TRINITY_DN54916_c0_g1~~TRINITY_DN54916_c0_g1_i1.p1  ORF type:complete len:116 (-),score=12.21 TRINITY_DN54916_c0_g1_i1:34-381(-)